MSAVDETSPTVERGLTAGVLTAYVIANLCAWTAILTPAAITLALRVREIDPEGASTTLSMVSAIGAVFGLLSNPIFGRLSDHTRSRFGMRRPWMLGGVVAAAIGLVVIASSSSIAIVTVGWSITQLGIQALLVGITAVMADQIPLARRGRIGGLISMGQGAATTLGSGLVALNSESMTWGLLAPIGLAAITVGILCLVLPDRRLGDAETAPFSLRELAASYWLNPRLYPDFSWMLLSRVLAFMGITVLVIYQAYFMMSRIGVPPEQIAAVMFGVLLLENALSVASNLVSGWLSDRYMRRKVFVAGSALVGTVGFAIAGLATSMPVFLVGVALLGVAKGVYGAVDLAMATDLLPRGKEDAAKDMGLFLAAGLLTNLLTPLVAPLIFAIGASGATAPPGVPAGNYLALFLAAGIFMLLGALAVKPIKGVR